MLESHLKSFCEEFDLGSPAPFDKEGVVKMKIASFEVRLKKFDTVFYLSALVAPLPTQKKEEFLLKVMKANFLRQGTGGSTLGLKEDESFLTLSLSLTYEVDYTVFKEAVEEFVNYIDYWKTETTRHEAEE